jgi:hypothetical protein
MLACAFSVPARLTFENGDIPAIAPGRLAKGPPQMSDETLLIRRALKESIAS